MHHATDFNTSGPPYKDIVPNFSEILMIFEKNAISFEKITNCIKNCHVKTQKDSASIIHWINKHYGLKKNKWKNLT